MIAPVGGLNSQSSQYDMPETDCWNMVNYYPREGGLEKRGGTQAYATGTTGNLKTIAVYSSLSGTESAFGFTASGIYNVTSSGAVGASVLARTVAKHQWTMFGDGTNNWLCAFNGTDKPAFYNGTTWTAVDAVSVPAITGVTTTGLIGAMSYQGRLFLIEKDKLKFWYLPAGAVGGAATAFDLSAQCARGGYLTECLPFTYDGGSGLDDVAIFLTSMGEAIVYTGTDPSDATKWTKRGTYYVGKPISRKCMTKVGGDVLIATESGVVRMSSAMNGVALGAQQFYVSNKIRSAYSTSVANSLGSVDWETFCYFKENAYFVASPSYVWVMNVETGAWTYFSWITSGGTSPDCYCVLNSQLYYGKGTATRIAWYGTTDVDSGVGVIANVSCAYSKLGSSNSKKVNAIKISYGSGADGAINASLYIDGVFQGSGNETIPVKNGISDFVCQVAGHTGNNFSLWIYDSTSYSGGFNYYTYLYEDGGFV